MSNDYRYSTTFSRVRHDLRIDIGGVANNLAPRTNYFILYYYTHVILVGGHLIEINTFWERVSKMSGTTYRLERQNALDMPIIKNVYRYEFRLKIVISYYDLLRRVY